MSHLNIYNVLEKLVDIAEHCRTLGAIITFSPQDFDDAKKVLATYKAHKRIVRELQTMPYMTTPGGIHKDKYCIVRREYVEKINELILELTKED